MHDILRAYQNYGLEYKGYKWYTSSTCQTYIPCPLKKNKIFTFVGFYLFVSITNRIFTYTLLAQNLYVSKVLISEITSVFTDITLLPLVPLHFLH